MDELTSDFLRSSIVVSLVALAAMGLARASRKRLVQRLTLRSAFACCLLAVACTVTWSTDSAPLRVQLPSTINSLDDKPLPTGLAGQAAGVSPVEGTLDSGSPLFSFRDLLVLSLLAGILFALLGLLSAWIKLGVLVMRSVSNEPVPKCFRIIERLGYCALLVDDLTSAASCRFLGKGYVLIPTSSLKRLTEEEFKAIVYHEIAHLSRGDHYWQLLSDFVLSLAWWNPIVHLLRHKLAIAHEDIADLTASQKLNDHSYVAALLRIAEIEMGSQVGKAGLAFNHGHRGFRSRVKMLLSLNEDEMKRPTMTNRVLAAIVLLGLTGLSSLSLVAGPINNQDKDNKVVLQPENGADGVSAYYEKQYETAINQLTEALEKEPKNTKLYFYRASAFRDSGKPEKAWLDFSRAIALDSNFAEAYYGRAGVSFETKQFELGIADYEAVIRLKAVFRHRAHDALVQYYLQQNDYNKALEHAEASVNQISTVPATWRVLAETLSQLGRFPEAEQARQKAEQLKAEQQDKQPL